MCSLTTKPVREYEGVFGPPLSFRQIFASRASMLETQYSHNPPPAGFANPFPCDFSNNDPGLKTGDTTPVQNSDSMSFSNFYPVLPKVFVTESLDFDIDERGCVTHARCARLFQGAQKRDRDDYDFYSEGDEDMFGEPERVD